MRGPLPCDIRSNNGFSLGRFCCRQSEQYIPTRRGKSLMNKQDAPNGIFTGCLMWPHLFPLYASQIFKPLIFKAILPSQLKYCVTVLEIIPEISF